LLTFFIMLVSLSEVKEEEKFQAMVESMRKTFGYDSSMTSMAPGHSKPRNSALAKLASLGRAQKMGLMKGGDKVKAPVGENPRVKTVRRGEQLTQGGVIYFSYGKTKLTEENRRKLHIIVGQVGGKPQKVEIRGHTTRRPPPAGSPFKDNWQLAYDRCQQTKQFLVDAGVRPKRIRLNVAAEYEPAHIGVDALLARENDRIEIVMINELIEDFEGTAEERKRKDFESR